MLKDVTPLQKDTSGTSPSDTSLTVVSLLEQNEAQKWKDRTLMTESEARLAADNVKIFKQQAKAANAQKKELQTHLQVAQNEKDQEQDAKDIALAHAERYKDESRRQAHDLSSQREEILSNERHHNRTMQDMM